MAFTCQLYQRLVKAHRVLSHITYLLQRIQWAGLSYLERKQIKQEQVDDLVWFVEFLNGIEQAICRLASPPTHEETDELAKFAARFQRERDEKMVKLVPTAPGQSPVDVMNLLKDVSGRLLLYAVDQTSLQISDQEMTDWLDLIRGLSHNISY